MTVSAQRRPAPAAPPRRARSRVVVVAVAVVLLAVSAFAVTTLRGDPPVDRVAASLDTSSLVPQIEPVDATTLHPRRLVPAPRAGEVLRLAGPFDESLRLDELTLEPSAGTLTGTARVLDEVSELIVLELQVAWYDQDGVLLDTSSTELGREDAEASESVHEAGGDHDSGMPFTLSAPAEVRDRVASGQVYVLVLVNE